MYDLSIILPTCNRAEPLSRTLQSLRDTVRCNYELIVVDGASSDRTGDVLNHARSWLGDRLRVIREEQRQGFVKAANKGFRAATGRCLTWLDDDARPLPGSLDSALSQTDAAPEDVAILALFHRWRSLKSIAFQIQPARNLYYCVLHLRGTLYANFGMARRQIFQKLDYFDERFFIGGADADFSLKAWHAGLKVAPAYCALIDHDQSPEDRRTPDSPNGMEDGQRLLAKWDLPPKNLLHNDFDPARPCTLRGPRPTASPEAA